MSASGGTKAVVAALLANTGIAITKFAAWVLTQSASMLAEAIHSVADAGNQALLLVGGKRAQREATEEHPFGYGRERYVYAFIVAIVLFSVGGLFALYEAYHKFHELAEGHGEGGLLESRWKYVPLVVLGLAIVMESFSFRTAIIESNKVRGDQSWWRFIRRAKAPELPVILLEDLAALLGLAVAFTGVGLALLTHNLYFDVAGSAVIGALLVAVAVILGVEVKSQLLGEAADSGGSGRDSCRDQLHRRHRRRHPPQDDAHRTGGATRRREDRGAGHGHRRGDRRQHRCRRTRVARRRADGHAGVHRARPPA